MNAELAYAQAAPALRSSVVNFWLRHGGDLEELASEANLIFMQAAETYDETRGAKLTTWVSFKVKMGLLESLHKKLKCRRLETSYAKNTFCQLRPVRSKLHEDATQPQHDQGTDPSQWDGRINEFHSALIDKPKFDLRRLLFELSEDAKAIVQTALDLHKMQGAQAGTTPKRKLVKELLWDGWTVARVMSCFDEIREALYD